MLPHTAPRGYTTPGLPASPTPDASGLTTPGLPVPPAPEYPGASLTPPAGPAYPSVPPQTAPPGSYPVPVGGYAAPSGTYTAPEEGVRRSGVLGVLALVLAIVTPIVGAVAGFEIGRRLPAGVIAEDADFLALLAPARDQVLWAETAFWTGTVLGIVAIVMGIIAIVRRRGRWQGITALIIALLGPVVFLVLVMIGVSLGGATGYAVYPG